MDDDAMLQLAADLAHQAGAAIRAIRARGFETRHKSDRSPVTEADHAAEAVIVRGLRAALPHIPVIAEEEIEAGHVHAIGREYWLVDPLDGTREFAAGRDEYTVNIGLVRDGHPVIGAVGVPAEHSVYGARLGPDRVVWKRDDTGQHPIQTRPTPAQGLHVLASRATGKDKRLDHFLDGRTVSHVTHMGSALKVLRLAEGLADLYPRFGPTMEWDTAAPQVVLHAAGGRLTAMDGKPLAYGKSGWLNPAFVCMGRG